MAKAAKRDPYQTRRDLPRWTVMVYMAAGDTLDLDTVAVRDLKEMEGGVNEHVNVVVQVNRHWPRSAQRYRIQPPRRDKNERLGRSEFIEQLEGDTDMGLDATLSEFLTDVASRPEYDAHHYFLVLWGHAYGLGFGRDHENPLTLKELKGAIEAFKRTRTSRGIVDEGADGRLDLLGANACSMSYVEAAFELRESADYMVASQITVPFAGWPYESILSRINAETDAKTLGRLVVDAYVSQFNGLPTDDRLAMTLLDLRAAPGLAESVHQLAVAIHHSINGDGFNLDRLAAFRDVFISSSAGDVRPLVDVSDLCDQLMTDPTLNVPEVAAAADTLKKSLRESTPHLVEHTNQHPDLEDLHGVGIYAPCVTDDDTLKRLELEDASSAVKRPSLDGKTHQTGEDAYRDLDLFTAADSGTGQPRMWPELVYRSLRHRIPADLMACIDGIPALQRADRLHVAQIILSIDSSLNKLDRLLKTSKTEIRDILHTRGETLLRRALRALEEPDRRSGPAPQHGGRSRRGFRRPHLTLVTPLDRRTRVELLAHARALQGLAQKPTVPADAYDAPAVTDPPPGQATMPSPVAPASVEEDNPEVVDAVVNYLALVERAIGEVERATKRGLTHARFGLGPMAPAHFGLGEPMKAGEGEPMKAGEGEPMKAGEGVAGPQPIAPTGDLRGDLALARVADLFRQVGESLGRLEQATADVENTARALLADPVADEDVEGADLYDAAAQGIERAFEMLQEAAANVRRTVRRVLAHPVYGLGPGEGTLTLDTREDLARFGGLDKRSLRLMSTRAARPRRLTSPLRS